MGWFSELRIFFSQSRSYQKIKFTKKVGKTSLWQVYLNMCIVVILADGNMTLRLTGVLGHQSLNEGIFLSLWKRRCLQCPLHHSFWNLCWAPKMLPKLWIRDNWHIDESGMFGKNFASLPWKLCQFIVKLLLRDEMLLLQYLFIRHYLSKQKFFHSGNVKKIISLLNLQHRSWAQTFSVQCWLYM